MSEKSKMKSCCHCGAEPIPVVHVDYDGHPVQYGWMCPNCRGVRGMSWNMFDAERIWNEGETELAQQMAQPKEMQYQKDFEKIRQELNSD